MIFIYSFTLKKSSQPKLTIIPQTENTKCIFIDSTICGGFYSFFSSFNVMPLQILPHRHPGHIIDFSKFGD